MVASRSARFILGVRYEDVINSIDWNRILIQAEGLHYQLGHTSQTTVCGSCVRDILLREKE